ERQRFLNWSLLVIAGLILLLGAVTVLPPILSDRLAAMWPWPKPQMILIVVLSLALLTLTGLLHQQRYIAYLRRQFEQTQAEEIARAKKHTNRMYALLNVTRMLSTTHDLESVFDGVTNTCIQGFNCHQASLMLFDKDTNELVVRSASGVSVPSTMMGSRLKFGQGVAGWAAKNRQALIIGRDFDASQYPELVLKNAALSSAMVVPIILRDELVGVLNVSSRSRRVNYDKTDLKALEVFAENVGSCIRHTQQATWMRQTVQQLQQSLKAKNKQIDRSKTETSAKTPPKSTMVKHPETGEFVIPAKSSD
ncbi:MAG: GAF domain-containing protein, partial [Candidatus Latescibacterota bacterium]